MSNRVIITLKVLVHLACLIPVAWLAAHLLQNHLGPDPTQAVTLFTGHGTLRLLIITLAISPIRKFIPKIAWIIRFRRMVGLYAFFYGCLHLMTYVGLFAHFNIATMVADIGQRRFILAGIAAWLLMLPLAVTSNSWSIRKLGGTKWRHLHWLIYVAALVGVTHYWWGERRGDLAPLGITVVLALVLAARPVFAWARASSRSLRSGPASVKPLLSTKSDGLEGMRTGRPDSRIR